MQPDWMIQGQPGLPPLPRATPLQPFPPTSFVGPFSGRAAKAPVTTLEGPCPEGRLAFPQNSTMNLNGELSDQSVRNYLKPLLVPEVQRSRVLRDRTLGVLFGSGREFSGDFEGDFYGGVGVAGEDVDQLVGDLGELHFRH